MRHDEIIDVSFQEVEGEIYLTAPQLAKKINDTDIRVRHWADVFGDLIGIEKINGRKRYKESDIYKFAFIKDLLDNKKFRHDQARIYLSKHGFEYAEYDSGLVDTRDPLGFQALASALSVEVDKKLNIFIEQFSSNISNQLNEYLLAQKQIGLETKAEIESAVDELVSERLETTLTELKEHIMDKEQEQKKRDEELIDLMRAGMEERKRQNEQEKKGFWNRIFNK